MRLRASTPSRVRPRRVAWVPSKALTGTTLVIADGTHAHTTDGIALTQIHVLSVADGTHAHSTDGIALTQVHVLTVADGAHAHAADGLTLTQLHILSVSDGSHAHAADSFALTQTHILVVADAAHLHSVDNVTLTLNAVTLVISDGHHAHTVDAIAVGGTGHVRMFIISPEAHASITGPTVHLSSSSRPPALASVGVGAVDLSDEGN